MPDNFTLRADNQSSKRRLIRLLPEEGHPIRIDLMGKNFIEVNIATDISLRGVGIDVAHGFEGYNLADKIEILILLPIPVSYTISATVRIVHIRDSFFGAEFERLERKDYKKLHAYIASRLLGESLKIRLLHQLRYFS